jgi:hypothetical protein
MVVRPEARHSVVVSLFWRGVAINAGLVVAALAPAPATGSRVSSPPSRRQPESRLSAAAATPPPLRALAVRPASVEEDGLVLRMQRRVAQRAAAGPERDRPDAEEPEGCT